MEPSTMELAFGLSLADPRDVTWLESLEAWSDVSQQSVVNIGCEIERWNRVRLSLNVESHDKFAGFLLDVYASWRQTADDFLDFDVSLTPAPPDKSSRRRRRSPSPDDYRVAVKREIKTEPVDVDFTATPTGGDVPASSGFAYASRGAEPDLIQDDTAEPDFEIRVASMRDKSDDCQDDDVIRRSSPDVAEGVADSPPPSESASRSNSFLGDIVAGQSSQSLIKSVEASDPQETTTMTATTKNSSNTKGRKKAKTSRLSSRRRRRRQLKARSPPPSPISPQSSSPPPQPSSPLSPEADLVVRRRPGRPRRGSSAQASLSAEAPVRKRAPGRPRVRPEAQVSRKEFWTGKLLEHFAKSEDGSKRLACFRCDEKVNFSVPSMAKHLRCNHGLVRNYEEDTISPLFCPEGECFERDAFSSEAEYAQHRLERHRKSVPAKEDVEKSQTSEPTVCFLCGALNKNNPLHMKNVHRMGPMMKERNIRCPVPDCNEMFVRQGGLKMHMVTHDDCVCPVSSCRLMFKKRKFMKMHYIRIHQPHLIKRLQCPFCAHRSIQPTHLRRHVKEVHTRGKVFECQEPGCFQAFKRRCHLIQHSALHLNKKPFGCRWCHVTGAQQNNIRSHASTAHREEFQAAQRNKERYWVRVVTNFPPPLNSIAPSSPLPGPVSSPPPPAPSDSPRQTSSPSTPQPPSPPPSAQSSPPPALTTTQPIDSIRRPVDERTMPWPNLR